MEIQVKKNRIFTKRRILIMLAALLFAGAIVLTLIMIATRTCLIYECPVVWVSSVFRFASEKPMVIQAYLISYIVLKPIIPHCISDEACSNDGKCEIKDGTSHCQCSTDYFGAYCEYRSCSGLG